MNLDALLLGLPDALALARYTWLWTFLSRTKTYSCSDTREISGRTLDKFEFRPVAVPKMAWYMKK